MTIFSEIKSKSPKSKLYAGQVIGVHTLVSPRGNPDLGPTMWWNKRCGRCGAVAPISVVQIPVLRRTKGCSVCKKKACPAVLFEGVVTLDQDTCGSAPPLAIRGLPGSVTAGYASRRVHIVMTEEMNK
jgi:hypothetical protein